MIWDAISFPNLDPALFTIPGFDLMGNHLGPFPLRWYALAYIAGLVLGWRWMVWLIRRDKLWAPGKAPLTVPQADDFLFWATLGVILGGRIGYILFYKPDMIWNSPLEMIRIWNGGMSFHGGLIGVALATLWFTRQKHFDEAQFAKFAKQRVLKQTPSANDKEFVEVKGVGWLKRADHEEARVKARTAEVKLLPLADLAAAAAPIGLFFGRLANFINGELWGRQTDVPWGVIFCNQRILEANAGCPAGMEPRHPSQLYEATLEGLVLFTIINLATLKYDSLRRPGLNTGIFLVCYGIFRASLEVVREPDAHMPDFLRGFITMGMLLSLPMIALGIWLINRALKSPAPKPA